MRHLVCVWLPHWPITRLRRDDALDRPLVAVETIHGQRSLASVGPMAEDRGLYPGQTLANARAMCPDLAVVEADARADATAMCRLAAWCERYTPLVAADPPDSLWLDITGCPIAHPDGGNGFARDIVHRLRSIAIPSRVAVAGTTGTAWALAHTMVGEHRMCVTAPGQERKVLSGLPIAALRLDPRIVGRLRRVGLRRIGELLQLSRPDLTSRFGPLPGLRLDQALGNVEEAIAWLHPPIVWQDRLDFPEPINAPDDLARALTLLTGRLCRRLAQQDQGARRFVARFYRTDMQVPRLAVATTMPTRDAAHLGKLLREKLDSVDPGFGIDVATLAAEDLALMRTEQTGLEGHGEAGAAGELHRLLDTLSNRLGTDRVWRIAPHESHQPERRERRVVPTTETVAGWRKDDPQAARPIRLLRRPEMIDVTALLPDDPPVMFHWRRVLHHVRSATGPERITNEWWRMSAASHEASRTRDYYRVEDQNGARFWIFRAGLHGEDKAPTWYLHGLFA
jgi:protein ImuB